MNTTQPDSYPSKPEFQTGQTLATKALCVARHSMEQPPHVYSGSEKQRNWLNKWLPMVETHPQVKAAREALFNFCHEYSKSPDRGRTIVIYGENGSGKSRMVRSVIRWAQLCSGMMPEVYERLTQQQNRAKPSAMLVSWAEIVDGFKRDEWMILEDLQAANLLAIDDLGAEHDPSRIGVEKLYVLLSRRENSWNLITTNLSPSAWEQKFERRIASRLYRNALHLDMIQVPDFSTV